MFKSQKILTSFCAAAASLWWRVRTHEKKIGCGLPEPSKPKLPSLSLEMRGYYGKPHELELRVSTSQRRKEKGASN